jgi:hypothetical protein
MSVMMKGLTLTQREQARLQVLNQVLLEQRWLNRGQAEGSAFIGGATILDLAARENVDEAGEGR